MNREDLEHIIRAAADITNEYEFVVVGSQSILGPIPNPPAVFTMSAEADIYPLNAIDKADAIDAAIGEGSRFHETYGRASGQRPLACRQDGKAACSASRRRARMDGLAIAWTSLTSLWRRR